MSSPRPPETDHQADQPRDRAGRFVGLIDAHAAYRQAITRATGPAPTAPRPPAEPPGARVDPSGWWHTTEAGDTTTEDGPETEG